MKKQSSPPNINIQNSSKSYDITKSQQNYIQVKTDQTEQIKSIKNKLIANTAKNGKQQKELETGLIKELSNFQSFGIKLKKNIKKYKMREYSQEDQKQQNAKKFIHKIKRQKEQFMGKLFLIKKKQTQENQRKIQQEQMENREKRENSRTERIRKALQNIQVHRYKTQKRYQQLKLKESSRNSQDPSIVSKIQLPVIYERFQPRKINLFRKDPQTKINIQSTNHKTESTPSEKYYKSKFYLENEKKKYYEKIQKLQKMQSLQKKKIYNQIVKKYFEPKSSDSRFKISTEPSEQLSQKKFSKSKSRQSQYEIGSQVLKIDKGKKMNYLNNNSDQNMRNEILLRSQTAETSIQAKELMKKNVQKQTIQTQKKGRQFSSNISQINKKIELLAKLIDKDINNQFN